MNEQQTLQVLEIKKPTKYDDEIRYLNSIFSGQTLKTMKCELDCKWGIILCVLPMMDYDGVLSFDSIDDIPDKYLDHKIIKIVYVYNMDKPTIIISISDNESVM